MIIARPDATPLPGDFLGFMCELYGGWCGMAGHGGREDVAMRSGDGGHGRARGRLRAIQHGKLPRQCVQLCPAAEHRPGVHQQQLALQGGSTLNSWF